MVSGYLVMASAMVLSINAPSGQGVKMTKQTTFDTEKKATYNQIKKACTHLVNLKNCPKDIKWGSFHGHLLAKANTGKGLKSGDITKILSLKSVPKAVVTSIRAYKESEA